MEILFFVVCFLASIVGAICGIGGGVIIKPLLDALQFLDVSQISFLSGCTVLSMSTYSVIKSKLSGKKEVDIAMGGAIGGIVGKWLFSFIKSLSDNPNKVGVVQAACLLVVTVFTLVYTVFKDRITTKKLRGLPILIFVGLLLGIMSSFLGIGGGPINLVVLFYLFSMTTKEAVITSLYIIFISQIASLATSIITNTVPEFPIKVLVVMVAGGILGGVVGRIVNKKIADKTVDKLFIGLMAVMIAINIYNIISLV